MADEGEEVMEGEEVIGDDMGEGDDEAVEVTEEGYCGRIGNSFKGILVGIILFFGSGVALFWNEGRAARRYAALKQGSKIAVTATSDKILPVNEGKLVVLSGYATTDETLRDPIFGIESSKTLQLRRESEMYQWVEHKRTKTKKKAGGKKVKTTSYSYDKQWSSTAIDSGRFYKSYGHQNPGEILYDSNKWTAEDAKLGAFELPSYEVERIMEWERYSVPALTNYSKLPSGTQAWSSGYYVGEDPVDPQIGDIRVTYSIVKPTDITIVAQQRDNTIAPFTTKNGGTIDLLQVGTFGKEFMFQAAKDENKALTWLIRIVGILIMYVGVSLVLDPLVILADVLPFLGDIVQIGVNIISGVIAIVVSFVVIAIAWIFYRPILSIILLVLSAVAVAVPFFLKKKKGKNVDENPTEETSLIV